MIHVYIASAFSKNNAGGNKAGIVLNHPELTNEEKMAISRKLGFSETAFVTPSDKASYRLAYFTPTEEVPLCGHATIATFATLHLLGLLTESDPTIETKAGILQIHVDEDGLVMMQQNAPEYYDYLEERELSASMGSWYTGTGGFICGVNDAEARRPDPIQIISTGLKDIILPIRTERELNRLQPDFESMTDLSRRKEVVGIHAFTLPENMPETANTAADDAPLQIDAVCRNFAPLYGIDEESATGTASCALAGYLFRYRKKKETYIFEQGYSMGLPSRITVKVEAKADKIEKIFVGGYGYLVEERDL